MNRYLCLLLFLFLLPGELLAACVTPINFNTDVSDSWTSGCTSENRPGSYAQYYTFTLLSSQEVVVDLESSVDSYLFLLDGSGETGSVIEEDDDSGNTTSSQITRTLSAGTYTVEATTFGAGITGNFDVSVGISTTSSGECQNPIIVNTSVSDIWESGCVS